jgi:hypothetical protein
VSRIGNHREQEEDATFMPPRSIRTSATNRKPPPVEPLDEALGPAIVPERLARRLDAGRDRGRGDDPIVPHLLDPLHFREEPLAVPHQRREDREDPGLDGPHGAVGAQLEALRVELEGTEAADPAPEDPPAPTRSPSGSPGFLQTACKHARVGRPILSSPTPGPRGARARPTREEMKKELASLPTRLEAGGVCIQAQDWDDLNVARIRFPAGADAAPLLEGLPQDLCPCPHWGAVLRGSIHVRYGDGTEETVRAGEVYYWPPGHTVRVDEDYEAVEFSPSRAMSEVIDHLARKLA